jgi:Bacterial Ig domain
MDTINRTIALAVLAIAATGCRDDDDSLSRRTADALRNSPPTIEGSPKTQATAGKDYLFQPHASDPDGQALRFAVENQPGWLRFDTSTGRLWGTPRSADVGRFSGIAISVSDGENLQILKPFTISVNPAPPTAAGGGVEAVDDWASTLPGQDVVVEVLANDVSRNRTALRVAAVAPPARGTAVLRSDGTVSYTPAMGHVGSDTFGYTVTDSDGASDTGSVVVIVRPPTAGDALMRLIAAAPEGSWLKVNGNRFEDAWVPAAQRAQVNGSAFGEPRKIITAWGSMTWDAKRRQLIIWGGGHADYAGNEVYRFDASTLQWQRASLPSAVNAPFGGNRYFTADGALNAPISSHTYDNLEFLPQLDRFITFGGANFNSGSYFVLDDGTTKTGPYLWDPDRASEDMVGGATGSHVDAARFPDVIGGRMWMNRDAIVTNGSGAERPGSFVNGTSAYESGAGSDAVLVTEGPMAGGDLFRYRIADLDDPGLDSWQLIGPGSKSYSDQGAGAYDPTRRLYLRTARTGAGYAIVMWNVATPGPTNEPIVFVPTSHDDRFVLSQQHGMDFDLRRSLFVLWNGDGRVWYLRPPSSAPAFAAGGWIVEPAPVSGASAPAFATSTGILGKWRYIETHDVMIGLGDGNEGQVWVYKPAGWQPP